MLRIHTSQRTEVLLDCFVRNLAAERKRAGAFAPVRVVVPNRSVETYLRLGVAERLGIAANLETTFLRKLLAGLAQGAVPAARMADAALVEAHLLALLHDSAQLERAELGPVRAYLFAAGSARDALDRRRCQLAAALAHLFDEYAGSRAELLTAWRRGEGGGGQGEAWQRSLWLAVFGPGGRLDRQAAGDGIRRLPLETLWDEAVRTAAPAFAGLHIHVFGLSYLGAAYHRMLGQLGCRSEVHVYTLNPCRPDERELRAAGEAPDPDDSHLALELWGRPGRENLRLLAQLDGATVDASFRLPPASSLLGRLQADIADRRMPAAPALPLDDDSLSVLPCPSLRRELEVVAAEIWKLLTKDPTLRACDIAVIVPERQQELYLAQLPAVFHESCDLPHNLADAGPAGRPRAAEAIALLIDLPFSTFSRKHLLPLLTHPCLMARFGSASAGEWRMLPAELGIVRGADRDDFDPAYLERDLFSWQQGLTRLVLGAVADPGHAEAPVAFALDGQDYVPGPPIDSDDESALGFGLLASSLIADARFASGATAARERPLAQWLDFLRRLVGTYVVVDDDAGQALLARFLTALDELDQGGLDTPVCYRVAAELARRALAGLPASRGHYLASGVTVATFLPMRAIPFRAIFVLGLGQGCFPRTRGRHELDLRRDDRRPGDVDDREQDLYMFLETLLSARDRLTLSYVSRDEVTGDEVPASAALLELRAILGRGYLGAQALARLFCDGAAERPRLRRYDDSEARRRVLPVAAAERQAKLAGERARQGAAACPAREHPGVFPARRGPRPGQRAAAIEIPLLALRRFLEDPLQGSARFALGMTADDDPAEVDLENEPFDLAGRMRSAIVSKAMAGALVAAGGQPTWDAVAAAHGREVLAAELAGLTPVGPLRRAALAREQGILRAWHAGLPEVLGREPVTCRWFRLAPRLGNHPAATGADLVPRPAPRLEVVLPGRAGESERPVAVTVQGLTGLWAAARAGIGLRFTTRKNVVADGLGKEDLAVFLEHLALTAAATDPGAGFASALFYCDKGRGAHRVRRFAEVSPVQARDYLARLCGALLAGGRDGEGNPAALHPYLLPHEAVLASHRKGTSVLDEIGRLSESDDRGGWSSTQGPVPSPLERYAAPAEDEARRMIDERFGLFFALAEADA